MAVVTHIHPTSPRHLASIPPPHHEQCTTAVARKPKLIHQICVHICTHNMAIFYERMYSWLWPPTPQVPPLFPDKCYPLSSPHHPQEGPNSCIKSGPDLMNESPPCKPAQSPPTSRRHLPSIILPFTTTPCSTLEAKRCQILSSNLGTHL